jgi:hypothetical protein
MKLYLFLVSIFAIGCNNTVAPISEPSAPIVSKIETLDISGSIQNWNTNKIGKAKLKWAQLIGSNGLKHFGNLSNDVSIDKTGALSRVLPSLEGSLVLLSRLVKSDLAGCSNLIVNESARIIRVFDEIYSSSDTKSGLILQSSEAPTSIGIESPNTGSKSSVYFYSSIKTTLSANCATSRFVYDNLDLNQGWNKIVMFTSIDAVGQPKSYRYANETPFVTREWFLFGDSELL